MERERVQLIVLIDLDPVPGAMHTEESARQVIESTLLTRLGHYHPNVLIDDQPFD